MIRVERYFMDKEEAPPVEVKKDINAHIQSHSFIFLRANSESNRSTFPL
jgi:hypothetical protein